MPIPNRADPRVSVASAPQPTIPDPLPACRVQRWEWSTLAVIVLVALAFDLFFFNGYFASDDYSYYHAAQAIRTTGGYRTTPGLGSSRLTMVGWLIAVGCVLPDSVQLAAASMIAWHAALIVLTWAVARRLFDARVALLSAWLAGSVGLFVSYSTCMLPDIPLAVAWLASFLVFHRGVASATAGRNAAASAWLALSGLAIGVGYMAKEASLLLGPLYFCYWLATARRTSLRAAILRGAAFAGAIAAVLVFETVALRALSGAELTRMAWTVTELTPIVQRSVDKYGTDPFERLAWVAARLGSDVFPPGLLWAIPAAAALYPIVCRRHWAFYALPVWAFAYFVWGSMNLTTYAPPSIQARYFIPVLPFALIVLCAVAVRVADGLAVVGRAMRVGRIAHAAGVTLAVAYPLVGLEGPDRTAGKLYRADIVGATARALRSARQQGSDLIVTGPDLSPRVAPVLLRGQPSHDVVALRSLSEELTDIPFVEARRLGERPDEAPPVQAGSSDAFLMDGRRWAYVAIESGRADPLLDLSEGLHDLLAGPLWDLSGADRDGVALAGFDLRVESVAPHRMEKRRSDLFLWSWLSRLPTLEQQRRADGRAVALFQMATAALPYRAAGVRSVPTRSKSWRGGSGVTLADASTGALRCEADLAADAYSWLRATQSGTVSADAGQWALLRVDCDLSDGIDAELVADPIDASGVSLDGHRARERLRSGSSALWMLVPDGAVAVRPLLKLRGRGTALLQSVSIALFSDCEWTDLTSRVQRFTVGGRGAELVEKVAGAGLRIESSLPGDQYVWVAPPRRTREPLLTLLPGRGYDFFMDVWLEDQPYVQLVMQFLDPDDRTSTLGERRIPLSPGLKRLTIRTGDRPLNAYMTFKFFGRGALGVGQLRVASVPLSDGMVRSPAEPGE